MKTAMTSRNGEAPIPAEEFASRQRTLAAAAGARGLSGVIVWSRGGSNADFYGDVMYLTNHHDPLPQLQDTPAWTARPYSALVLPTDGEATLIVHNHDYSQRQVHVDDVRVSAHVPQHLASVLKEKKLDDGRLGLLGRDSLLQTHYALLEEMLGASVTLEPAAELLDALRMIKSEAELALIRRSAEVGVAWMDTMMSRVEPGVTEADVVGEGLRFLATQGAYPYDVAVSSGPNSAQYQRVGMPGWDCSRRLAAGDLLHIDAWGPVNDYYTDFARSSVVGGVATAGQCDLLEAAVAVIHYIIDAIEPGRSVGDLFLRGQEWLSEHGFAEAGFGDLFPCFGHGIGLGLEHPWILEGSETLLQANMVLAVEIMLTRPGVGGVAFEDNVIVTEDGGENLTAMCPAEW